MPEATAGMRMNTPPPPIACIMALPMAMHSAPGPAETQPPHPLLPPHHPHPHTTQSPDSTSPPPTPAHPFLPLLKTRLLWLRSVLHTNHPGILCQLKYLHDNNWSDPNAVQEVLPLLASVTELPSSICRYLVDKYFGSESVGEDELVKLWQLSIQF